VTWDGAKGTNKVLTLMGFGLSLTLVKLKVTINYITSTTIDIAFANPYKLSPRSPMMLEF